MAAIDARADIIEAGGEEEGVVGGGGAGEDGEVVGGGGGDTGGESSDDSGATTPRRPRRPRAPPEDPMAALIAAFQAIAGHKKIPIPTFQGKTGEDPVSHLLKTNDWMTNENTPHRRKHIEFSYTLSGDARQWYDEVTIPADWVQVQNMFKHHFSRVGRSQKQLHDRWRALAFDPLIDDAEVFIRSVKELARQLGYNEMAICNCVKSCMPDNMSLALRRVNDLAEITETITDYYPCHRITPPKDTKDTTPFSSSTHADHKYASSLSSKEVSFDKDVILADSISQLSLAVGNLQTSTPPPKPFKPYATPPGGRGRGRPFFRGRGRGRGQDNRNGSGSRFERSGSRGRQNTRTNSRDTGKCHYCREYGHWKNECPKRLRNLERNRQFRSRSPNRPDYRDNRSQSREGGDGYRSQSREGSRSRDRNDSSTSRDRDTRETSSYNSTQQFSHPYPFSDYETMNSGWNNEGESYQFLNM